MESKKESVRLGSRYLLHDLLGRGGMGAVYLATDRLTGSRVALKHVTSAPADLMFGSRGTDPSNLNLALAQEFKTLASMRHPNVVSVLDYGFDERRQPYFTMEFVPGATPLPAQPHARARLLSRSHTHHSACRTSLTAHGFYSTVQQVDVSSGGRQP
jgi:serine/threonine protein kinase